MQGPVIGQVVPFDTPGLLFGSDVLVEGKLVAVDLFPNEPWPVDLSIDITNESACLCEYGAPTKKRSKRPSDAFCSRIPGPMCVEPFPIGIGNDEFPRNSIRCMLAGEKEWGMGRARRNGDRSKRLSGRVGFHATSLSENISEAWIEPHE